MTRKSGITLAREKYGLPEPGWQPNPQDPTISLGSLIERRAFYSRQWLGSKAYETYVDTFKNAILQSEKIQLNQAMCLGLGSLSDVDRPDVPSTHETGMMQLVAFESWIILLRQNFDIDNIYFQDPAFTDLDVEFLKVHGFKVIQSPESETIISDQTFLYLPCVDQFIIDSCLSRVSPPVLINSCDLGWYYRQYRTRSDIRMLFEEDYDSNPNFHKLQHRPDEAYEIRIDYMNHHAVEYRPAEDPTVMDQSLAVYWTPNTPSECSNYRKEHPEFLTADEAYKYWDNLEATKQKNSWRTT